MLIEITHRDRGTTLVYPMSRAMQCYGVDLIAEALAGTHPSYVARQINGRGLPIERPAPKPPTVTTLCVWCDPPRVIAEEPSDTGQDREVHGICRACRDRMLEEHRGHLAVEAHWTGGAW